MKDPADRLLDDLFLALGARPLLLLDLLDDFAADALAQFASRFRRARVGQERRNQGGTARRQRPPRRPDVQRRDVPVTHILLVHRVKRCLLQRKRDFNQTTVGHLHSLVPPRSEGTQ